VQRSHDLGATWLSPEDPPRFISGIGDRVDQVWHVEPGRAEEPGSVYLGVSPADLFRSDDYGSTWNEIASLSKHPSHSQWQLGLGGLCLHSIVPVPSDANRMWVGISAVGVFGTTDSGETWTTMNQGVRADFLPDRYLISANAHTRFWPIMPGPNCFISRTTAEYIEVSRRARIGRT
jgi:hypothetical protein